MAEGEGGERKGGGVRLRHRVAVAVAVACSTASGALAAQTPPPATAAQAPVPTDPQRLAVARTIIAKLLPDDAYRQMMNGVMKPITDNMAGSLKDMPMRRIAVAAGLTAEQAAKLGKVDVAKVMAILDPHWEERQQLMMTAMIGSMTDFLTTMQPEMREAYAEAFAHRFTLAELDDLSRFFATPTGAKYAAQYLTVASDPAVIGMMKSMMPRMMAQMPAFIAAAQKATAGLPPARKPADLTGAERDQLARALGVDPSEFQKSKTSK